MIRIRPFCNRDLPRLAMLWVIHHGAYRPPPTVTAKVWEQAIASRHFFVPQRLLVAVDREPLAWCQWFVDSNRTAALAAFCFDTTPEAETAAAELLAEVMRQSSAAGMTSMLAGIGKDSRWGYQGLEPIGPGIGIDMADDRTNQLFEEAGFQEHRRLDRWEVATGDFRPPVSRESLTLRRTTRIESATPPTTGPTENAAMFHFDVNRYQLLGNAGGDPLAVADLWIGDPDSHVMSMHQSILGDVAAAAADSASREAAIRYLIAGMIPVLAGRHILAVHRSVAADNHDEAARLAALHFHRAGAGRLMHRKLAGG